MASEARTGPDATATTNVSFRIVERSRQVWLVLAVCLLAFIALCGFTVYGMASFLSTFTVAKGASLEPHPGSTLAVLHRGTVITEQVSTPIQLQEGDTVIVPQNGRGFMRLFDESTIQISLNTEVVLDTLRSNEFFGRAQDVGIILRHGSVRVARSPQQRVSSHYVVSTALAEVDIEPDAKVRFSVASGEDPITQVVVEVGHAKFRSKGKTIELGPQQMAWANRSEEPQGPLVAETDMVKNGDFAEGPTSSVEEIGEGGLGVAGWLPIRDEGAPPVPSGSVTITEELGLPVARIFYDRGDGQFPRVGMVQQLNESAEFYNTIELTATVKLVRQDAPVRGPGGDVYPLIVKVVYGDSDGKLHEWKRSFYFSGDAEDLSDVSRIKVPVGKWESTGEIRQVRMSESQLHAQQDLIALNSDLFLLKSPGQDVAVINAIEVYGSGPNFESWITGISLLAR